MYKFSLSLIVSNINYKAMRVFAYIFLFTLMSLKLHAVNVLVNTTGFTAPYYTFSVDDGTSFDFTNSGTDSLTAGVAYIFTGNNTSHPFRMFITDNSSGTVTDLVNNLSFRGTQTFTLDPSIDYSTYTGTYICNYHPSMVGSFNISTVPEPSTYSLVFGSLALGLVALRRR